jgi:DNA-directed RNA polymerase specialized sigma subunit
MTEDIKGLSKAAENYDGRVKFFLYASNWVRPQLYRGLTNLHPGSHANHPAALLVSKSNRIQHILQEQLQRKPTDEEIASELNVKVSTYRAAKKAAGSKFISAENGHTTQFSSGGGTSSYLDTFV